MKKNKIQLFVGIIVVVIIIVSSINIVKNVLNYNDLKQEEISVSEKASSAKKRYVKHKKEIEEQVYATENESENELVKEVAVHNNSYMIMQNLSSSFFEEFFTWKDSEEYQERKNKLKNIADNSLLENKKIFDEGKDSTGGDYIKALGLQSEFISSEVSLIDNQTAIVKVIYKSWYDKKSDSGEGIRYYQVDFDRENQKIKDLKLVFSSEKS